MRTRPVTLECSAGSVTVRVPRPQPGPWNTLLLKGRGWLDRRHNHEVEDSERTYSLHVFENHFNIFELDAITKMQQLRRVLCAQVARADAMTHSTVPSVPEQPTLEGLAVLRGRDRQSWADEVRAWKTANKTASETRTNIEAAKAASLILHAELAQLDYECDIVRHEWAKAWHAHTGIYTRARFTGRHAEMSATPTLPKYRPARELTTTPTGIATKEN